MVSSLRRVTQYFQCSQPAVPLDNAIDPAACQQVIVSLNCLQHSPGCIGQAGACRIRGRGLASVVPRIAGRSQRIEGELHSFKAGVGLPRHIFTDSEIITLPCLRRKCESGENWSGCNDLQVGNRWVLRAAPLWTGTASVVWQDLHEQKRHEDRWSLYHALTWLRTVVDAFDLRPSNCRL